jgi:hypothetical protein
MDDSRLVYAGEWNNITYDPLVYRVSKTPGSTISFQFKGERSLVHGKPHLTPLTTRIFDTAVGDNRHLTKSIHRLVRWSFTKRLTPNFR